MRSLFRISATVMIALLLSLSSCVTGRSGKTGFVVSLVNSGEPVLTDEHIATYAWDVHHIVLTPRGVERWESFAKHDGSGNPPVPKLGELTGKEFMVTLDGKEMYRGHFWSMASSLMKSGVLMFDTLGNRDQVWISFTRLEGKPEDDPRGHPAIEAHFRALGKLR